MSVDPGFGGQSFRSEVLSKARELSAWMRASNLTVPIEMDVWHLSAQLLPVSRFRGEPAGAGSSVFGADDAAAAIRAIRGDR